MDHETQRRVAENEVRFRAMNERRRRENGDFRGEDADSLTVMCECAAVSCTLEFELELEAYLDVRSHPRWFVIRAGHELPEAEDVVRDLGDDRMVVEKSGAGVAIAEGGP